MTKDNPLPRFELVKIVWPNWYPYPQVKRGLRRKNPSEYRRIKQAQERWQKLFDRAMKPYRVGSFRDWDGDGYFTRPLYLYEGKYYGSY